MRVIDVDAIILTCTKEMAKYRADAFKRPMSDTSPNSYLNWAIWNHFREYLAKIPTIEVESAKRGRWICFPESMKFDSVYCADQIACSECKQAWDICDNDTDTFNYCPYCGAKMDGEAE